ncbi:MAG: hypothetical protein GY953_17940 [bacterium]|nr:hypothetical protein [bacterium]
MRANNVAPNQSDPSGNIPARSEVGDLYKRATGSHSAAATAIGNAGGSRPHSNLMATLCVHFIIALFGIYPSRH